MNAIVDLVQKPTTFGLIMEDEANRWLSSSSNIAKLRDLVDKHLVVAFKMDKPTPPEILGAIADVLGMPPGQGSRNQFNRGKVPGFPYMSDIREAHAPEAAPKRGWLGNFHFDGVSAYTVIADFVGHRYSPNQYRDMAAVYQELPDWLRSEIKGRYALAGKMPHILSPFSTPPAEDATPERQPLVIRHPKTGSPILRPPPSPYSTIEGLPELEGRAILSELWNWTWASPSRFEFQSGGPWLYIWEGVRLVHNNPPFDLQAQERSEIFYLVPGPWSAFEAY